MGQTFTRNHLSLSRNANLPGHPVFYLATCFPPPLLWSCSYSAFASLMRTSPSVGFFCPCMCLGLWSFLSAWCSRLPWRVPQLRQLTPDLWVAWRVYAETLTLFWALSPLSSSSSASPLHSSFTVPLLIPPPFLSLSVCLSVRSLTLPSVQVLAPGGSCPPAFPARLL